MRNAYTSDTVKLSLIPGESEWKRWALSASWGWYGFVVTVDADAQFRYEIAGHLENGDDSISDPAMGGLI